MAALLSQAQRVVRRSSFIDWRPVNEPATGSELNWGRARTDRDPHVTALAQTEPGIWPEAHASRNGHR